MAIPKIGGVLCCGNVVLDIAVWPAANFDRNTTTWVETIAEGIGGNGANTSYTLAKLGVPVTLISKIGADDRGNRLIDILASAGVDASRIGRSAEHPTPCTVVLVHEGGDRKFFHRPGASRELQVDSLEFKQGGAHTHFHLANPFALPAMRSGAADLMRRARAAGLTTSIDTGWDSLDRWLVDLAPSLPWTDLLFVNEAEGEKLGGVAALQQCGVPDVVVKTGPQGCLVYTSDHFMQVPGFPVNAADTTGAGDCFAGAFLAGLYREWPYEECARFANAAGALNVQKLGATTGVLGFEETAEWIRRQSLA